MKASVPGGYLVRVRFGSHSPELIERLKALNGVREVRAQTYDYGDTGADIYADRGGPLVSEIAGLAATTSVELTEHKYLGTSLENLFLHHTGRNLRSSQCLWRS